MPRSKQTVAELRAENKLLKQFNASASVAAVLSNAIRWGVVAFIAYQGRICIQSLAGHVTFASIGVNFLGSISVGTALAWAMGGGGVLYGVKHKRLHQNAVKHLHQHNKSIEGTIDPKRSTSHLTDVGDTNPADKD